MNEERRRTLAVFLFRVTRPLLCWLRMFDAARSWWVKPTGQGHTVGSFVLSADPNNHGFRWNAPNVFKALT